MLHFLSSVLCLRFTASQLTDLPSAFTSQNVAIDNSRIEEIDLLLMLNKGKYYRNTAEVGRKSDYVRALGIFSDVAENVKNLNIDAEKKLHLLLDAKINVGRVSRYSYEIEEGRRKARRCP